MTIVNSRDSAKVVLPTVPLIGIETEEWEWSKPSPTSGGAYAHSTRYKSSLDIDPPIFHPTFEFQPILQS